MELMYIGEELQEGAIIKGIILSFTLIACAIVFAFDIS